MDIAAKGLSQSQGCLSIPLQLQIYSLLQILFLFSSYQHTISFYLEQAVSFLSIVWSPLVSATRILPQRLPLRVVVLIGEVKEDYIHRVPQKETF